MDKKTAVFNCGSALHFTGTEYPGGIRYPFLMVTFEATESDQSGELVTNGNHGVTGRREP